VRGAAVDALGSLGAQLDAEALREIVGLLHDENSRVRRAAVKALGPLGPRLDANALRAIVGLLHDVDWQVRAAVVSELELLGPRLDANALREIVGWLRDEDEGIESVYPSLRARPPVRQFVVQALGSMGALRGPRPNGRGLCEARLVCLCPQHVLALGIHRCRAVRGGRPGLAAAQRLRLAARGR
jgi:HEAT repeat protein